MVLLEEQLIAEFKGTFERLALLFERQQKRLDEIAAEIERRNKTEIQHLISSKVITANTYYETSPVSNRNYNRCRIEASAGFTANTTAGVRIDLYYRGSKIGTILEIKGDPNSKSGISEPIDIKAIPGFNFIVVNKDKSQDVTVSSMKCILYND